MCLPGSRLALGLHPLEARQRRPPVGHQLQHLAVVALRGVEVAACLLGHAAVQQRGVAPRNAEPGDLYAEIQIVLPSPMDDECIELIKKLDEHATSAHPQEPRRELKW